MESSPVLYLVEAYSGWIFIGCFVLVALACWFYPTSE